MIDGPGLFRAICYTAVYTSTKYSMCAMHVVSIDKEVAGVPEYVVRQDGRGWRVKGIMTIMKETSMNLIVEMGIPSRRFVRLYGCSQQTLEYFELKRIKVIRTKEYNVLETFHRVSIYEHNIYKNSQTI